jgi:hypothetical protein
MFERLVVHDRFTMHPTRGYHNEHREPSARYSNRSDSQSPGIRTGRLRHLSKAGASASPLRPGIEKASFACPCRPVSVQTQEAEVVATCEVTRAARYIITEAIMIETQQVRQKPGFRWHHERLSPRCAGGQSAPRLRRAAALPGSRPWYRDAADY